MESPTPTSEPDLMSKTSSSNDLAPEAAQLLPHTELNPSEQTTILFIHGAVGSREGWRLVVPFFEPHDLNHDTAYHDAPGPQRCYHDAPTHHPHYHDAPTHHPHYHLLLPDLPGHASSTHTSTHKTFSIPSSSRALASLIRAKSPSGTAHIVGLSLGANIAIHLATHHPDVVASVFASGYSASSSLGLTGWKRTLLPYAVWLEMRLEDLVPRALVRWAMDGTDIRRGDRSYCTVELCRAIFAPSSPVPSPRPWEAKTLVVVAGKSGLLPTADSVEDARMLVRVGRLGNGGTKGVRHAGMRHPWCLQEPRVFAEAVKAWIEERGLPEGFEDI